MHVPWKHCLLHCNFVTHPSPKSENVVTTKYRTEMYRASFIPPTTYVWNELPKGSRNMKYFSEKLKIKPNPIILWNIKHAQLQMQCSKLNVHFFLLHVANSLQCSYGHEVEDSGHFFLTRPLYLIQRQDILQKK